MTNKGTVPATSMKSPTFLGVSGRISFRGTVLMDVPEHIEYRESEADKRQRCAHPGQHGPVCRQNGPFNRELVAQFQIFGLDSVLFHCFTTRRSNHAVNQ